MKKALIVLRKWHDEEGVGNSVKEVKKKLEKKGWMVQTLSREDDLNITSLSGSMGALKEFISVKDKKEKYDLIYTQDWSLAFPLLIPKRIFKEKHFCFFHDLQQGENSKIFQKIAGNMLGNKLVVKSEELKRKFPKAILNKEGVPKTIFSKNK